MANKLPDDSDVWESISGYNKLGHILTITNSIQVAILKNYPSVCIYFIDYNCPAQQIINFSPIASMSYFSSDQITSSGSIFKGYEVIFQADNSVNLCFDFEVKAGGQLLIDLGNCIQNIELPYKTKE